MASVESVVGVFKNNSSPFPPLLLLPKLTPHYHDANIEQNTFSSYTCVRSQMDEQVEGWGWEDGWMEKCGMDGSETGRQVDGWLDRQVYRRVVGRHFDGWEGE